MKWRMILLALLAVASKSNAQLRIVFLDDPLRYSEGRVTYSQAEPNTFIWRSGDSIGQITTYPSELILARAKVGARIPPWLKYRIPDWKHGDRRGFRFTSRVHGSLIEVFRALFLTPPRGDDSIAYFSWPAIFQLLQAPDQGMARAIYERRHQIRVPQMFGPQPSTFDPLDYITLDEYLRGLNLPVDLRHIVTYAADGGLQRGIMLQGWGHLYLGQQANTEPMILTRLILQYMGTVNIPFGDSAVWEILPGYFGRSQARPALPSIHGAEYSEAYFEAKEAAARDQQAGPGSGGP